MYSFKVLMECPIIIALLFQLYRTFVNSNVPLFIPHVIKVSGVKVILLSLLFKI